MCVVAGHHLALHVLSPALEARRVVNVGMPVSKCIEVNGRYNWHGAARCISKVFARETAKTAKMAQAAQARAAEARAGESATQQPVAPSANATGVRQTGMRLSDAATSGTPGEGPAPTASSPSLPPPLPSPPSPPPPPPPPPPVFYMSPSYPFGEKGTEYPDLMSLLSVLDGVATVRVLVLVREP